MKQIKTLEDLNKKIIENEINILFFTNNLFHSLCLEDNISNYYIITIDNHPIIKILKEKNIKIFSLEEINNNVKIFGNVINLLHQKEIIDFISFIKNKNALLFKNSTRIEYQCAKLDINVLSNKPNLSRFYENKTKSIKIIHELGIKTPHFKIERLSDSSILKEIEKNFSIPFIVQFSKGNSGNSSFIINEKKDFERIILKSKGLSVRISEYIKGISVTINACTTKYGTYVSYPFIQLTGIKGLTPNELGACGNSFFASNILSKKEILQCKTITRKIGDYLYQKGYKGFFGIDYIYKDGVFYFIEINSRFVSSLPFFTKLQLNQNEFPLLAIHIMEMLNYEYKIDIENYGVELYGNSLLFYNSFDKEKIITQYINNGIYDLNEKSFKKSSINIKDLKNDEFILISKKAASLINPGIEYSRIYTKQNIINNDNLLKKEYEKLKYFVNKIIN